MNYWQFKTDLSRIRLLSLTQSSFQPFLCKDRIFFYSHSWAVSYLLMIYVSFISLLDTKISWGCFFLLFIHYVLRLHRNKKNLKTKQVKNHFQTSGLLKKKKLHTMTPRLPTLGFEAEKWTGSTHWCQVFHFTLVSPILKFLCLRQSHVKFPSALIVVIPELPLWVILKIALQKSRRLITIKWWLALRAELHRSQDSHSISMNWPVTIISPNTYNQNVISKTKQHRSNYLTGSNKIHFFCFGYIMRGMQADMSLLPGLSKLLWPTATSFWILSKNIHSSNL